MIRYTLSSLAARWWRAALTGLSAVVGVGIVSGTLILGDTADRLGAGGDDVQFLRRLMFIAGAVALLVGAFIVNVTISVTVAQRSRELALLRCLGADRAGIRRSVLTESAIIGIAGAAAGLVVGFGVATALRALVNTDWINGELPGHTLVLTPRTVLAALLVGCVVSVLSALAPARRAARVPPIAAARDLAPPDARRRRTLRAVAGSIITAAGLCSVPVATATANGYLLIPGAAVTLVGLRLLAPYAAARLAWVLGGPVERLLRAPGELGRRNAVRNPDRTGATMSALLVGPALLSLIAVLGTSTKAYVVHEHNRYRADFEIRAASPAPGGKPTLTALDPNLLNRLAALPELSTLIPVPSTVAVVAGERAGVDAVDPAALLSIVDVRVTAGRLEDLTSGSLGVTDEQATAHAWSVGSHVDVQLPGGTRTLTVRAIYAGDPTYVPYQPSLLMTPADYIGLGGDPAPLRVFARVAPDTPRGMARAAIDRVVADYPTVGVETGEAAADRDLDMITRAMRIYFVLAGLAGVVGLFGIVNILALSTIERRRELGLLRAVGMEREQVRWMVRAEAVIMAIVGVGLGIGVGLLFGWGGTQVLAHSSSPTRFTLPVGTLAAVAALAVVAGLGAAVLPARLASRLDVLRSIAAE